MKQIQNNIWKVFYILTFTSFLFFVVLLVSDYKHLTKQLEFELETNVQLVANSISYKLAEQELLLESLGKELLQSIKSDKEKQEYLDAKLKKHPSLSGFGLLDKEGNFLVTSSNVKVPKGTTLFKNDTLKYYFTETIKSSDIVIGQTRFFKAMNKWVIPLRKAIRDENGTVLGVMGAGFVNEKNQNFIDKLQLLDKYSILVVKDVDHNGEFYRQYASGFDGVSEERLYLKPLNQKLIQDMKNKLYKKYQLSMDEIKISQKIVSMHGLEIYKREQYTAMVYDVKYKHWVLLQQDSVFVIEALERTFFIYLSIFSVLFLLLFWLFKRLASAELKNKKDLIFQAEHDELTLLPNRKYMYKHIKEWQDQHGGAFDVLYLDLDNFKNINDKFGHTIGDKILQEVAKRLESFFSREDMLIRQGGDEFIVFLAKEHKEGLEALSKSLIQKVSELYVIENNEFRIGLSLGISSYPKDSKDINELLSFADTAMYKAKGHKNYYAVFSEEMRHEALLKSDIEHELRGAIEAQELSMNYQPQINREGKLFGVEALLRWNNKKLGFVSPALFIEVAEQTGMMDDIGDYVIQKSLYDIKSLQQEYNASFRLSINISVVEFMESDFLEKLMVFIQKSEFQKELLTLEVTESLSISELDKIVPLLEQLRTEGIDVSLDDFGTGYSSLSSLRKLPISELKIDKSFIDAIEYNMSERKLVQSIIEIGKNFEMSTVAEGVESQEQVEILKELGCDIIQGYYYSKPLTLEQLKQYIQKDGIC